MKTFFFIFLFIVSSFSSAQSRSELFVFKTKHQGYTCERWGKKGYKQSSFEKKGYRFKSLDISRNTRRVRIVVMNIHNLCEYESFFDRLKGETFVSFETSKVSSLDSCQQLKLELDEMMSQGWNYKILNNKYLSVYFNAGIESECTEQGEQSYARFVYTI